MPRFIEDLDKFGHEVTIWEKGREKSAETFQIESVQDNQSIAEIPQLILEQKGGLLSKLTGSSLVDKEVLIKIPLGKFTFFTSTTLNYNQKTSTYTVTLDQIIYKSQQRSNYRLMVSEYIDVEFKINDRVYPCNDISAGGTSFTLEESERSLFEKDQTYQDCELLFNKKKFFIPKIKIAGIFPNKNDKGKQIDGLKVGVAFSEIPSQVEEDLTIYINSEARAEEIQKRFKQKKK